MPRAAPACGLSRATVSVRSSTVPSSLLFAVRTWVISTASPMAGRSQSSDGCRTSSSPSDALSWADCSSRRLMPVSARGLPANTCSTAACAAPGGPSNFAVLDALALAPGDRHQGALHRRRFGNVQLQKLLEILLDALVVGAQGEQNLPQFLPSLLGGAGAQPLLWVGAGRNQNGADDVAEFLAGGGAHGPADRLDHVYRALAGLQKSHRAQGRRIGALAEYAHVEDTVRMRRISRSQPPLCGFAGRGVARSVQVLQAVVRHRPCRSRSRRASATPIA